MTQPPAKGRGPRVIHQRRAQGTLESLVAAGEALLDGRDPDTLGVDEILDQAAASSSSFYQRFGSKRGFFDHLHERFCARIRAETAAWTDPARWEGKALAEVARAGLAGYLAFRRANAGPLRSFEMLESRDGALLARRQRVDAALARAAFDCVAHVQRANGAAPPPDKLRFALDLAVARLSIAAVEPRRVQASTGDDAALVEALAEALTAYLGG